jgi:nitrogen regulatory protein PII
MRFKLLIAFVEDSKTDAVMDAARKAGATGSTVINNARGEGIKTKKTFLGLSLETQRDVILFLVEEHLAKNILETISLAGKFDSTSGTGIVFQIDVEDALGVSHQIQELSEIVEEQI